ncbi:MAG: TetR/AcrR family transcriptional regulator [Deltaproteobacteria bacterium]|nr:TetR/AcrR family transcriptional regulator [Deltaproteobacteria bacterium]
MARKPDMARRAALAAQAFEAIRARGVHQTSMSDLALALGIKRPTLYFYFRDLGEIFEAVLDETNRRMVAFVAGRLADAQHPLDVLEALVRAQLDFHQGRRDVLILLFQLWAVAGSRDPERILERGRAYLAPVRAGLVARLQDGIAAGQVAPCHPEQVVDLALAVADGALVQHLTRGADVSTIVAGLHDHVLAPLRRRPGAAPPTRSRSRPGPRPRARPRPGQPTQKSR